MIKRYWRKPRRRDRNTDGSSGSFSRDSASFEFSYEFTAGSYKHINLPKGCLKRKFDHQQDQNADKLVRSNQLIRIRKVVTFQHVCIREYERIVGDNPSCSRGAPVSLGWEYCTTESISLEEFEQRRSVRRSQHQLQLSPYSRSQLLLEWGVSNHEIVQSVRAAVKAKRQRRRTVASLGTYDVIEEMIENTSSTIIRALKVGKGRRHTMTDQVKTEIERLAHYCSESEISRGALVTLDKLANDYPDIFTAATSSPSSNDCTTVSELEFNGSPGSQNFIASIDMPRKISEIQHDRAPIKPRRELSPIRTDSTKMLVDMTIDCISAALDKSCSLFMSDPDFDLPLLDPPLEISSSVYQDFDSSITTRETQDERILHFSFAQHPYFDKNTSTAMTEKAPLSLVDNLAMGDGDTTIDTGFVQAMVQTDAVFSPNEEHSACPIDDTDNGANGSGLKTEPAVTETDHNDDDSSIDSHLIKLLLGIEDTLPHPEQSGSTWPETSRMIVSSDIPEIFVHSIPKLHQSMDLKDTGIDSDMHHYLIGEH